MFSLFSLISKKRKLKLHEKVRKYHDQGDVKIPKENVKCNLGRKAMETLLIIYAGTEYLLEEIHACDYNSKSLSAAKITKHSAHDFSIFIKCPFHMVTAEVEIAK